MVLALLHPLDILLERSKPLLLREASLTQYTPCSNLLVIASLA
jgi:hypothetical protein